MTQEEITELRKFERRFDLIHALYKRYGKASARLLLMDNDAMKAAILLRGVRNVS